MVVPITDVVKMTLWVADISVEPIIGTPLLLTVLIENLAPARPTPGHSDGVRNLRDHGQILVTKTPAYLSTCEN